jgi:FAD/FMN-containing dehydrogenase
VNDPYNYPFTDNLPELVTDLLDELISGNVSLTPAYGRAQHEFVAASLAATGADDIWGPSKNLLFYIRATTLRVDEFAYTVLTRRRNIQRVVNEVTSFHERRLRELGARGLFPMNAPLQFRVSGLEHPRQVGIGPAEAPALAATTPRRDRPEWDVAIWFNALTFPGTPGEHAYYRELERWMRSRYRGFAMVRPEWSKGWAFADDAAWADRPTIRRTIPRLMSAGRRQDEDWDWARRRLNRYDPHRVFSNHFLDQLLPP